MHDWALDLCMLEVELAYREYREAETRHQVMVFYDEANRVYQAAFEDLSPAYLEGCEVYFGPDAPLEIPLLILLAVAWEAAVAVD